MIVLLFALMIFPNDSYRRLPDRYLPAVKEVLQAAITSGDVKSLDDFKGPYYLSVGMVEQRDETVILSFVRRGEYAFYRKVGNQQVEFSDYRGSGPRSIMMFPIQYLLRIKPATSEALQTLELEFIGQQKALVELYDPNAGRPAKYQYHPVNKPAVKQRSIKPKAHRRGTRAAAFFLSRPLPDTMKL